MGCVCSLGSLKDMEENYEASDITLKFEDESTFPSEPTFVHMSGIEKIPRESNSEFSIPEIELSEIEVRGSLRTQEVKQGKAYVLASVLMKYSPGLSVQFIPRYCVLTESSFSYFKSIHSFTLDEKPLVVIEFNQISEVSL
jgi:hypothetical protein